MSVSGSNNLSERTRSCAGPMTSSRLRALFCAGGAGPSHQELIDFVDRYRDAYEVEPICRLLQIAPSGYRRRVQQRNCPWLRCKRSQSDEERCSHIQRVWHANWQVYGTVKVWKQMHREGLPIARCTVQRLMRKLGLEGARRGKKVRTTRPDTTRPCPLDLVNRQFKAGLTNFGSQTSPMYLHGKGRCLWPL